MNRRVIFPAAVGAVGALGLVAGCLLSPQTVWRSYLIAYAFGVTTALGGLLYLMTGHLTRARWFVIMRRPAEALASTVPVFALLFAPLVVAARSVWPWAVPTAAMSPAIRAAVEPKRAWLSLGFFTVRAVVYLAVWGLVTVALLRLSRRGEEAGGQPEAALRQRAISGVATPAVVITITFAAFDWMMSLEPAWRSTVYGLYVFAGGCVAAVGAVTVLTYAAYRAGTLPREVSDDHFHAAGKVLLAMVIFWAYLAFFQYMLIWIADVPDEVSWVLVRTRDGWGAWAVVMVLAQFALPFVALLFRAVSRVPHRLALVAGWVLAAHYVDLYWLLAPAMHPERAVPYWTDAAALAFIAGVGGAVTMWRWGAAPAIPTSDPNLGAALRYHSP